MSLKRWILQIAAMTLFSSAVAEFDATIPVLDMKQYYRQETKEKFVKELYDALHEVGFFAIVNTGVNAEILDNGYRACFEYFALPFDEKMRSFSLSTNGQRGYVPGESAKGSHLGDFKEFYHVGRERSEEQARALSTWQNIWPSDFNLKDPLYSLFTALQEYTLSLSSAISEAMGAGSGLLQEMIVDGDVLMRAIHYPANPPKESFWAAEHTDIDLFTILPRATAEGLQVRNKEGEWIDVKVPENAFIVNGGDMLENITNGEFRSGLHRVVAKRDGYERYSLVFFVHPRSQDRLDPLQACIDRTGGVPKYAKATRLELLEERLVDLGLASPVMMQHLAESGLMERLIEVGRASPKAMKKLREAGLASEAVLAELLRLGQ
jgi:isopenicillin N synthase-like dioxygenase